MSESSTSAPGRIRARLREDLVEVKVLLRHPMETGSAKHPQTGQPLPRHFIREVVCRHNETPVLTLDWGWGIASDPYLAFVVKDGQVGDTISVEWIDNRGETGRVDARVD